MFVEKLVFNSSGVEEHLRDIPGKNRKDEIRKYKGELTMTTVRSAKTMDGVEKALWQMSHELDHELRRTFSLIPPELRDEFAARTDSARFTGTVPADDVWEAENFGVRWVVDLSLQGRLSVDSYGLTRPEVLVEFRYYYDHDKFNWYDPLSHTFLNNAGAQWKNLSFISDLFPGIGVLPKETENLFQRFLEGASSAFGKVVTAFEDIARKFLAEKMSKDAVFLFNEARRWQESQLRTLKESKGEASG